MLKVKYYNSTKYQKTTTLANVLSITCMPEPDDLEDEDRHYADGAMLTLYTEDERVICLPHSLIISIEEA